MADALLNLLDHGADTTRISPMQTSTTLAFDDRYEIRINWFIAADNNHLFNEVAFFQLHATSKHDIYAQLVRLSDAKVFATIAFYDLGNNVFASPKRGTFGGLTISHPIEMQSIETFVNLIVKYLEAQGAESLHIKFAPLSHDLPRCSVLANILTRNAWVLTGNEINQDMRVDGESFLERIDTGNAKRIRKCQREGFVAEKLDLSSLEKVYELIAENRMRRGHPLTMTFAELNTMATRFPDRTHIFGVYADSARSQLVAAGICLATTESILYVFYWGDVAGMETHSPIVLLASAIYEFCQREGFRMLDAGISTVDGEPNHGLMNFKRRLGFSESMKPTFSRRLA